MAIAASAPVLQNRPIHWRTLYKNIGVTFIARLCSAKFVVPYVFETSVHNEFVLIVKGENGMMLITCWGFDGIILTC